LINSMMSSINSLQHYVIEWKNKHGIKREIQDKHWLGMNEILAKL